MDETLPVSFVSQMDNNNTNSLESGIILNANESDNITKPGVTPDFPRSFVVISTTFFILIFLLGIIGNVLVMSVVCFNRNMKTAVNLYLLNLCVADILVLTICMPTALAEIYTKDAWYFGEAMCKLSYYVLTCLFNILTDNNITS